MGGVAGVGGVDGVGGLGAVGSSVVGGGNGVVSVETAVRQLYCLDFPWKHQHHCHLIRHFPLANPDLMVALDVWESLDVMQRPAFYCPTKKFHRARPGLIQNARPTGWSLA